MPIVPFGDYTPDMPDFGSTGTVTATNVIPINSNYEPFNALAGFTDALGARCQGAFAGADSGGNTVNFAGDIDTLYKLGTTTFADVSKAGGYSTGPEDFWSFVQYGNLIIASNYAEVPQSFELGVSTLFADLSATAPRAKYMAVVGEFLFLANVVDTYDGTKPDRLWWGPIGDPAGVWASSQSTQSDFQDFPDGGAIQGVVPVNRDAIIITERRIERMVYEGTPSIFGRYPIEQNRGTQIPGSIIKYGDGFFYYGDGGFYMFNGNGSIPIGDRKVDQTFLADLDESNKLRMTGAVDPLNKLVMWAYPGAGNTDGLPNKIIMYNWAEGRWSLVEEEVQALFSGLSQGYTLEQLDSIESNLDLFPYSLDSRALTGGAIQLSGFDSSNQMGYFDGSAKTAVIETGEFQGLPNRRSYIEEVRPIVEGGTITVESGTRETLGDSVSYGSSTTLSDTGEAGIDADSRYHRIRTTIAGGFTNAQGVEYNANDSGIQ